MSVERYNELVTQLCAEIGLHNPEVVLKRGSIEVDGCEVLLANYSNDKDALYLSFHFGLVPAGRSLRVFKTMLEANMTVYAQDQAQLGMNPDTTGVILLVRIAMVDDIDGKWMAETITHYNSHAKYWRTNILESFDDMYAGVASGMFAWMRV